MSFVSGTMKNMRFEMNWFEIPEEERVEDERETRFIGIVLVLSILVISCVGIFHSYLT